MQADRPRRWSKCMVGHCLLAQGDRISTILKHLMHRCSALMLNFINTSPSPTTLNPELLATLHDSQPRRQPLVAPRPLGFHSIHHITQFVPKFLPERQLPLHRRSQSANTKIPSMSISSRCHGIHVIRSLSTVLPQSLHDCSSPITTSIKPPP